MQITKRSDNGIQQAIIENPNGRAVRVSLGTRDRKEALRLAKEAKLDQVEKLSSANALTQDAVTRLIGHGKHVPIEEAFQQWASTSDLNGRSKLTVEKNRIVTESFATDMKLTGKPVAAVTTAHVRDFINAEDDRTAATRKRQLSCIKTFFQFCVIRGYLLRNPAAEVQVNLRTLPQKLREAGSVKPFTQQELDTLHSADLEGWWPHLIRISELTGLRFGDVAQLEWDCITPEGLVVWTEKRDVRVLLEFKEPVFAGLKKALAAVPRNKTPYLFPEERAFALHLSKRSRHPVYFKRILERLGIDGKSHHSFRHAAVRRWRAAGFNLDACREWAGHTSAKTTRHYAGEG